jgi:mycothiol synthase
MRRPHLDNDPTLRPLPAGYEIRLAAGDADVHALSHLLTTAFPEEGVWDEARVRSSLTEAADVLAVYVVTWEGVPVATASSRTDPEGFPGSGYVHWVGGLPDHAGQGLGSALMARLLQDFRDRGTVDAVLETDDFRLPAIKVYLRHGYLPVYQHRGEDHQARWSAVMQTLLGER